MLEAQDIGVRFGGVVAVDGVSVSLAAGEWLGVVGPNGSGKTTFLNALTGAVPATGSLRVEGVRVPLGRPRASRRAGLMRVFQAPQIFTDLTCLENVLLASADREWMGFAGSLAIRPLMWKRERARWIAAEAALEQVGLGALAKEMAADLTYGQQRLLDIARGLCGQPRVLLLDEPSAGLNDAETDNLAALLRTLYGTQLSVLLIEHKVDFLDRLCDRLVVLELGKTIAEGSPSEVWSNERVVNAYLGVAEDA
jgi:branched-chain amino acid transport system ATP-binding protein